MHGTLTAPGALLGLFVVTTLGEAEPRATPVTFERIGSEEGLSHNSVYAITHDRQGFVWIGTADGLNR